MSTLQHTIIKNRLSSQFSWEPPCAFVVECTESCLPTLQSRRVRARPSVMFGSALSPRARPSSARRSCAARSGASDTHGHDGVMHARGRRDAGYRCGQYTSSHMEDAGTHTDTQAHTGSHRDTETQRHAHTGTHTHTDTHTDTCTHTDTHTQRETQIHTRTQIHAHTGTHTYPQCHSARALTPRRW